MPTIRFTLDGAPIELSVDGDPTALELLREQAGVTTVKDGCSPQGACGCCTAIVNGRPALTCLKSASQLEGATVETLAGLAEHKRAALGRAFTEVGGLQCGFCTPGIAMRAAHLLDKDADADADTIRGVLGSHLCRCTGYHRIVDAIRLAGQHWHDGPPAPTGRLADERYEGAALALGDRAFTNDLQAEGLLHGALRLTEHPRARIRSIDVGPALAIPGVRAVLTAADLLGAVRIGHIRPDWSVYVAVGGVTHCIGSALASVAAESRAVARASAAAIVVDYEVLEPVTDPEQALRPGAPQVHPDFPNLVDVCRVQRGDVDAALSASAHVLTETFRSQRVEHAFVEPESCLVVPEEGGLHVYTQGQGVHEDRRQIAEALGWPEDRVRVTLVPCGGGFGGKEDLSVQHHAALLAHRTDRPVKLALSRDESMRLHPKRHPFTMTYTVGCDTDGHLTAVRARIVGDTGGYLSVGEKVLERAAGHSCGPYRVPAVDVEASTVYTNNPTSGAFRGFGVNQTAFAIDGMLDRLAELVGLDGYDIRERNILNEGEAFATGQLMDAGIGIRPCLEAVRDAYKGGKYAGIGCAIKNTGIGNGLADTGRVLLRVEGPERLALYTGFTEMGQGLFTVLRGLVSAETGVPAEQIRVETSTAFAVVCGMTTASRATMLTVEAGRRACEGLKEALSGGTLADLVGREFAGEFVCDFTVAPGGSGPNPITQVTFGYAAQVVLLDDEGQLQKVVAAHDVGRVMNRVTCEGQIEGGVHMGLGFALTEDLPSEGGHLVSSKLADLGIIKAKHVPEIEVLLVEVPDPHTTYGVKGVGEIGLVPTAPAVAAALRRFDGIWRTNLPMRGSAAARAVLPRKMREEDHV
jgi:selenium-dependent xanthine dehydrogenase